MRNSSIVDVYGNPFRAALVFESHSWRDEDKRAGDRIYRWLKKEFNIWYDDAPHLDSASETGLALGDEVCPKRYIRNADFFLFLASEASMASTSTALKELIYAENLARRGPRRIGLVRLEPYRIPSEYSNLLFATFNRSSARRDLERLTTSLKKRLADLAGLRRLPGLPSVYVQTDSSLDFLLEAILDPDRRGIYSMNAILRAAEKEHFLERILSRSQREQDAIADSLIHIYLSPDYERHPIARCNAAYYLSRMRPGRDEYAKELWLRHPREDQAFLFRGFYLSVGFLGDRQGLHDYVTKLESSEERLWQRQRLVNEDFHVRYYGSREGALARLRKTIMECKVPILELNVATIAQMSNSLWDLDLLDRQRERLLNRGVDERVFKHARRLLCHKVGGRRG